MNDLFQQLLNCLVEQKATAEKLAAVSRQHLEALKKNDIEAMKSAVSRQEALTGEMDRLQKLCIKWRESIRTELNVPEEAPLSSLVRQAPDSLREKFPAIMAELRVLGEEIKITNETNRLLTQNALIFNRQLLNILFPAQGQTYKNDGAVENKQSGNTRLNLTV